MFIFTAIGFIVIGVYLYLINENFKAHGAYNQESRDMIQDLQGRVAELEYELGQHKKSTSRKQKNH